MCGRSWPGQVAGVASTRGVKPCPNIADRRSRRVSFHGSLGDLSNLRRILRNRYCIGWGLSLCHLDFSCSPANLLDTITGWYSLNWPGLCSRKAAQISMTLREGSRLLRGSLGLDVMKSSVLRGHVKCAEHRLSGGPEANLFGPYCRKNNIKMALLYYLQGYMLSLTSSEVWSSTVPPVRP